MPWTNHLSWTGRTWTWKANVPACVFTAKLFTKTGKTVVGILNEKSHFCFDWDENFYISINANLREKWKWLVSTPSWPPPEEHRVKLTSPLPTDFFSNLLVSSWRPVIRNRSQPDKAFVLAHNQLEKHLAHHSSATSTQNHRRKQTHRLSSPRKYQNKWRHRKWMTHRNSTASWNNLIACL